MTQAADLGQIANQAGTLFRARVNASLQALASGHSGSTEPSPAYPNMLWFDQGSGLIKLRDPTSTAWNTVGSIGPPMKWTAVDVPSDAFTTGDIKATFKATADPGWVMMNDGSIGNAVSGATARANADRQALFALLWSNIANAWAPLQDVSGTPVGRGASAASDWAALRRLVLPKALGRALCAAGWGAGLTARALGETLGEEAHALTPAEGAAHSHGVGTLAIDSTGAHTQLAQTTRAPRRAAPPTGSRVLPPVPVRPVPPGRTRMRSAGRPRRPAAASRTTPCSRACSSTSW